MFGAWPVWCGLWCPEWIRWMGCVCSGCGLGAQQTVFSPFFARCWGSGSSGTLLGFEAALLWCCRSIVVVGCGV